MVASRLDDIVRESRDGIVIVSVRVVPRAGRTELAGVHGDALKIRVAAPPVDGRANETARAALADALGIAAAQVDLVSGEHSRAKQFAVRGLPVTEVRARVAALLGAG
jgi:uncharacterized protein (TIGR00251 family)